MSNEHFSTAKKSTFIYVMFIFCGKLIVLSYNLWPNEYPSFQKTCNVSSSKQLWLKIHLLRCQQISLRLCSPIVYFLEE